MTAVVYKESKMLTNAASSYHEIVSNQTNRVLALVRTREGAEETVVRYQLIGIDCRLQPRKRGGHASLVVMPESQPAPDAPVSKRKSKPKLVRL